MSDGSAGGPSCRSGAWRPPRKPRIGIEDNDVADAGGHDRRWPPTGTKLVSRRPAATVEFVQLAPLAFPPDPLLLSFVPQSLAMEQEETIAARRRSVAAVEFRDPFGGGAEQLVVTGRVLRVGICQSESRAKQRSPSELAR